ncbi:hypothetical protein BT96DRAFT_984528 [Gymnopus androsaceus JB14]|uniref:Uncharacterized protein n=1 Tax=Gymnopus androsaceus JB14 TaxID=1447944 RepID=A0A6A4IFM4_9AGAR|nr:hypothetical protein BT96DRAFT_984528 [Gymnopus androsaceus JB14]
MSTGNKESERPLKNQKRSATQTSHKTPGHSSPSCGPRTAPLLVHKGNELEEAEIADGLVLIPLPSNISDVACQLLATQTPLFSPTSPLLDIDHRIAEGDGGASDSMHADPADKNPHCSPIPAAADPSDLLSFRKFTPNIGEFERVVLDVLFLCKGHLETIVKAVSRDPGRFLAAVPLLGGLELYAKVPDLTKQIAASLADAGYPTVHDFAPNLIPGGGGSSRDNYGGPNASILEF